MRGLEKLAHDHAYWADRVRTLKRLGEQSASVCDRRQWKDDLPDTENWARANGDTCIQAAYEDWRNSELNEFGHYEHSFDEFWEEAISEGDACLACQNVRRYKAERMQARKRLGAVRAAITRVGRRLVEQDCETCGTGEIDETNCPQPAEHQPAPDVTALVEALKEIRSRSAMNLAMNPNPYALTAMLGDIHQIAGAALAQENKA